VPHFCDMSILMYSHFHRQFPFNFNSSWMKATYAGGKHSQIDPPDPYNTYINVNKLGSTIDSLRVYFPNISEEAFLKMMGQQATEYYLWKQTPNVDYIGCTTYRRYLYLNSTGPINEHTIHVPVDRSFCEFATSESAKEFALDILQSSDMITNHNTVLANSVEAQYLEWEPPHYWNLFKQAIHELYPEYRQHLHWFTSCNVVHFETTYIMRRDYFLKYAEELFNILRYIIENTHEPYPVKKPTDTFKELLPWRYPGFIGERFMPFFTYANGMKKHHVPMMFVGVK